MNNNHRMFFIKFDDGTNKVIRRLRISDMTDEEVIPLIILAYEICNSERPNRPNISGCFPIDEK